MTFHDEADAAFAEVVSRLRANHPEISDQLFSGQVAGLLLATAIRMSKDGGCPKGVLLAGFTDRVRVEYEG